METLGKSMNRAALVCCIALLACGSVNASPTTFAYTGHVTQLVNIDPSDHDPFNGTVHDAICVPDPLNCQLIIPATIFSGTYTFDSVAVDAIPDPQSGAYFSVGPPFGFSLDLGGFHFVNGGVGIVTENDYPSPIRDGYGTATLFPNDNVYSGDISYGFSLYSDPNDVFGTDGLPLLPPDLALFLTRSFNFTWNFTADDNTFVQVEVIGTIDSLTTVPEPGTIPLLGVALLSALGLQRRLEGSARAMVARLVRT
jgi:PEP-CTERM motif